MKKSDLSKTSGSRSSFNKNDSKYTKKKKNKKVKTLVDEISTEALSELDSQVVGKALKNVKKKNKSSSMNDVSKTNFKNTETKSSDNEWDSYPSDSEEESSKSIPSKLGFADVSSESSSSEEEDDKQSEHSFDAESYPSDTEDEEDIKKGLPRNAIPSDELKEREQRTIFVGNLPNSVERPQLKKWFFKFGKVECVRLRSAPISDPELPRKVAVIKKTFHDQRSNISAYVRFKNIESARNALQANGALFKDHIIRVDLAVHEGKYDSSKGVFVGNVPFSLEEDALRDFFSECGEIESVRIIRDKNTGVGKGFAYVNFKCSTSVPLALKLDGETIDKRELRVKPIKYPKKNSKLASLRPPPEYHSKKFFNKKPKKFGKVQKGDTFQGEFSEKRVRNKPKKKSVEERKREKFSKILTNKSSSGLKKSVKRKFLPDPSNLPSAFCKRKPRQFNFNKSLTSNYSHKSHIAQMELLFFIQEKLFFHPGA